MKKTGYDTEFWNELREKMTHYTDQEVIEILRKRKSYEPEAARIATDEAIRRNLIHSEQDLFSTKFSEQPSSLTLFPCPEKLESRDKIIRSISRMLMLTGVIPAIFGVLKFPAGKYPEGIAMLAAGLLWIFASFMISSRHDKRYWPPLLVIGLLSAGYVTRMLLLVRGLRVMDYVIPAILFALVLYLLFFLRALLNKPSE
jgi:hypothetical protein